MKVSLAQTYRDIAAKGRVPVPRVQTEKFEPGTSTPIRCNSLYYLLGAPLPDRATTERLQRFCAGVEGFPIMWNDPAAFHTTLLHFEVGERVRGRVATPYNPRFHKLIRDQLIPLLPVMIQYREVILTDNGGLIAAGLPTDVDPEKTLPSSIDKLRCHFGADYPNIAHVTLGYLFKPLTAEQHLKLLGMIDSFNASLPPDGIGTVFFDSYKLMHETRQFGNEVRVVEEMQIGSTYEHPALTDNGRGLMRDTKYSSERHFLQALCGMFGISEGNDSLRLRQAQRLQRSIDGNSELEDAVRNHLPEFAAYTATGEHRFMPVAIAAANILRGRPVFDISDVTRLVEADPRFAYLTEVSPWLANAEQVPEEYIPPHNNGPTLEVPERKENYSWLDIGSAPKTGGAPTLNILYQAFSLLLPGTSFRLFGADIAFPHYQVSDTGEITPSWYADSDGNIKDETTDPERPITYLNAGLEPYDVTRGLSHFPDGTLDFITACKVLYHLATGPWQRIPFTSLQLIGPNGKRLKDKFLAVPITAQQQLAIDVLLRKLAVDGTAMLELKTYPNHDDFTADYINKNIDDMMFMIQRRSADEYVFYSDSPILYRPDADAYSPQSESQLIEGSADQTLSFYNHPGITTNQPARAEELCARANKLVFLNQGWKRGAWGSVTAVIQKIQQGRPFQEIFTEYLRQVPDDDQIKKQLLEEAAGI